MSAPDGDGWQAIEVAWRTSEPETERQSPPSTGDGEQGKKWTTSEVTSLFESLGGRELHLLALFTDGNRSVIPAAELAEKFGTGVPFDFDRDLARTARFCEQETLEPPLAPCGAGDKNGYVKLTWPSSAVRAFHILGLSRLRSRSAR